MNEQTTTTPPAAPSLTVQVPMTITLARVSDLLCSAFEGGSNYWYEIKEQKEPERFDFYSMPDDIPDGQRGERRPRVFPHLDYPLNPGGSLLIAAGDEGDPNSYRDEKTGATAWRLDLEAVGRGLALLATAQPSHFADFLAENDDATTGDVFLQLCLFGEVVFG